MGSCGRAGTVGGEGRSRRLRVALAQRWKKEHMECNSRGTGFGIVGNVAMGRDTRSSRAPWSLDSEEMSLLYENHCFAVGFSSDPAAPITG